MKKMFFVFSIIILFSLNLFSIDFSPSELETRLLFSESLELLFNEQKYEARIKLTEAISGEVYIDDLPKLWYYAAKLDLQLGLIDRAKADIDNILLFSIENEEVRTMLNFIESFEKFSLNNYSLPTYYNNLESIYGSKDTMDRFFTITDIEIINSTIYILDSHNKRIFKQENQQKIWIKLPDNVDFYSIHADKNLNRMYLGSSEGIYYFDCHSSNVFIVDEFYNELLSASVNDENNIKKLVSGFPYVIFDVDKSGRIFGYNPFENSLSIIGFNGKILEKYILPETYVIFDGTKWHDDIYVLEYSTNSLIKFNSFNFSIEKIIPLKEDFQFLYIDVVPWGNLILNDSLGNTYTAKIENDEISYEILEYNEKFKGFVKIKNGIITFVNNKNYLVDIYRIESSGTFDSYNINFYGLNLDKDNFEVHSKFSVTDLVGQKMEFITKNLFVEDSGGRVSFNYYRKYVSPKIYYYENINDFFDAGIAQAQTDSFIILKGSIDKILSAEQIIPLLLSSSSVYYLWDENDLDNQLKEIIYTTGGQIINKKHEEYLKEYLNKTYKPIEFVSYKLYPPILPGIKNSKITINLKNKSLSDSLYYYIEGAGYGE